MMKKAVGHGRIQQGGNNASVKHVVVSLKSLMGLETGLHPAFITGLEHQLQGEGVPLAAEQTPAMTILGADRQSFLRSHMPSPSPRARRQTPANQAFGRIRSGFFQRLFQVRSQVVVGFAADREADQIVGDARLIPFLGSDAGVGHRRRMLNEAFNPAERDG